MAWIGPDDSYSFTILRLLEGLLNLDSVILTAGTTSWNLIVGGVEQAVTAAVHPGDSVKLSMTGKNLGRTADNFVFTCQIGTATPQQSPIYSNIAVNAVTPTFTTSSFVMPDANVPVIIQSFNEE